MKTKQIIMPQLKKAELIEVDCFPPKDNELTVELEYSAISAGTEKANFLGLRNSIFDSEDKVIEFPRYPGYSAAGVVIEVGAAVKDIKAGDRVAVYGAAHKKRNTISDSRAIKLPDGVSAQEASMAYISIFPLAAIRKTRIEMGESAMVMGLGILGIIAVQQLRAAGAYPIIAVDPLEERRKLALKLGADFALDPTEEGFAERVKEISGGGVNVCIEVTGLGVGLVQALDCMRKLGRVALLGCTRSSKFEIDYYSKVHGPGISLIGAHTLARPSGESFAGLWTVKDDLKTVLNLIVGKRLNFKDIIGEIASPADAQDAYDRLIGDKKVPVGILFDWSKI